MIFPKLSRVFVLLLAACVLSCGTGCGSSGKSSGDNVEVELLKNNDSIVAHNAIPSTFEKTAEFLLSRKFKPLASNSGPSGQPRFEVLTETGVNFKNYLDRIRHPYQLIETGAGVAIADYDNDGHLDIYLVGSDIQNKLYRGLGEFKFEDVTEAAGVNGRVNGQAVWGSSGSFADVDGDGDLDLFVCNMAAPNLLYINQGDGTFLEQSVARNVNHQGASKSANFCDYDRDGDLDMYLLTYQDFISKETDTIEIVDGVKRIKEDLREYFTLIDGHQDYAGEQDILYLNDGNGVFEKVTQEAGIEGWDRGLSCMWWDHDNDGWQDIYVANDFKNPDHLYRNNGDGTFTDVLPNVIRHSPWFSMGMDVGDLNNDGLLEHMVADMSNTSHYKQKLNMGNMGDSGWFLSRGEPRQYMKNAVYLNSGAGSFMEVAKMTGLSSTNWSWAVRFVDLDNDSWQDLFVTNGHARDSMNSDISNQFAQLRESGMPQSEIDKRYAHIPAAKERNLAFKNMGNLRFTSVEQAWNLDHEGVSHGVAFADFDSDGDLDMVVNNYYENSIVYRNNGTDGNRLLVELRARTNNSYGYGSRIEIWQGDNHFVREMNPVRGYLASDNPAVHFGLGDATKIDRMKVTWPDGSSQSFKDLDTGRIYRIIESPDRQPESSLVDTEKTQFKSVAQSRGLKFKHVESQFDDYEREHLLPYQISMLGSGVAWGDVNGDGFPDAFCGGAAGQTGKLFINQGGEKFEAVEGPWSQHAGSEDKGVLFFDSDGDGDNDLYVASGSNEGEKELLQDRLYLNSGNGEFANAPAGALPDFADSSSSVSAVDFDHDGDLDLFVGSRSVPGKYPITPNSRLLINDGGKFTEAEDSVAPGLKEIGLVNSAIWSDYNNDGWHDLVLALDWGPVTVFQNDDGVLNNVTSSLGIEDQRGWWHGITAADLDDDGDMDFVVTNQGVNTKYHTDKKHPHRVYYHDFDENGVMDLVEAEYEGDTEFPVRGRSCSSCTMPFIAEKFETFHEFANASLTDIYDTDIKSKPFREVNNLAASIFWNDGDQFRVTPLPRLAQISPSDGVQVADFDGDSIQDILLTNNFFGPQPETGYFDGGVSWLLKGNGNGEFAAVWPNESGVVLPDDNNGLSVADFDGDGDFDALVGVNSGETQLLENQSDASWMRIELKGPKHNLDSIGASLVLSGKVTRRMEVNAGGSYMSQAFKRFVSIPMSASDRFSKLTVSWPDGKTKTMDIDWNAQSMIVGHE